MRRRITLGTLLLAVTTMTGCAAPTEPSAGVFDGAFGPLADLPALPYRVADQTGLIRGVATVEAGEIEAIDGLGVDAGIVQLPGRGDALFVHWLGGMCDRRVLVVFASAGDRSGVRITRERDFGGCLMAGIRRVLMLEFTRPVDGSTMSFELVD